MAKKDDDDEDEKYEKWQVEEFGSHHSEDHYDPQMLRTIGKGCAVIIVIFILGLILAPYLIQLTK